MSKVALMSNNDDLARLKWNEKKVNRLSVVGGKSNDIEQDKDKDNHLEIVGGKGNDVEQEGWNVDGHARTEKSSS